MTRVTTKGGAGQTVFAIFLPLQYLGCATTRWVYDKTIPPHFAIAKTNITRFERRKQDYVTSGQRLPLKHRRKIRRHLRTGLIDGSLPKVRGSGSTIAVPDKVINSFDSLARNHRVTSALSGPY